MSNSYRIRTKVGVDKSIRVLLDQDFEYLEILSLKILQSQIYTRQCSDYGVVVGRVTANNGYGIPNAKVSVFIPLSTQDETNPIVSDLYPYKSLSQLNDDGYRYNLLPYVKSYSEHVPTGTFFTREDVLIEPSLIEVFDKYYRYTAKTNDSGDFMIFGVPIGEQTLHVDIDLSDMGEFSLSPQDLIRMGIATESQVAGTKFKSSSNLSELPQIISINRVIEVEPLWGQPEICNLGITRTDFDLTDEANISITPTAIFMGSIFSDSDRLALKKNCKPRFKQGELCSLITGPGEILSIRQTIQQDVNGRPLLEEFALESGGQVIDDNGTWLIDVPMNLDFVTTNEFGEKVISNDPKIGIPTKGKYRFKIKWNQSPSLSEDTKRGYFLVPNVREYGWDSSGSNVINTTLRRKSYAFSLDWNDYADIPSAINCDDTFYYMTYNKVYSVSQLIDQHRKGTLPNRFISVKNILDDNCESDNNRFPTNDGVFRLDIIYLLFLFAMIVFRPILYVLIFIIHAVYVLLIVLKLLIPLLSVYFIILGVQEFISATVAFPAFLLAIPFILKSIAWFLLAALVIIIWLELLKIKLKPINIPILLYDQCEFCNCDDPEDFTDAEYESQVDSSVSSSSGGGSISQSQNPSGLQLAQFYNNNYFASQISGNPLLSTVGSVMAGQPFRQPPTETPSCDARIPITKRGTDSNGERFWIATTSLTLAERINLFNTKAKYFNQTANNPGGGVNRIKASFNQNSNTPVFNWLTGGNYHYDNIVMLMLTPESAQNIAAGNLLTFQDPSLSLDKNLTGGTLNAFNNNAITGTSVTNLTKTIYYADFNSPGTNLPVTYTLPLPNSADTNYHKYPVDIEYFQVVTAMTYNTFNSLQGTTLSNSLNSRFLNNNMLFLKITDEQNFPSAIKNSTSPIVYNPIVNYSSYQTQVCVFLVRGVDPYSTRQTVTYCMGKIFGHTNEDAVKISGQYKLNQPIVGGFKNIAHNIGVNNTSDTYSSSKLYFENFTYQPSQFLTFQSNLPSYYSKLDNNLTSASFQSCCSFNTSNLNSNVLSYNSPNTSYGVRAIGDITNVGTDIVTYNSFVSEFSSTLNSVNPFVPPSVGTPSYYFPAFNASVNRGYYYGEIVEGGSLMVMSTTIRKTATYEPSTTGTYLSISYPTTTNITYPTTLSSSRETVMRSDRLPASTKNSNNCGVSYLLQNNDSLGIYKIPDDGVINTLQQQPSPTMSQGAPDTPNFSSSAFGNDVIDSLNNCADSVPLECYDYAGNQFTVGTDCKVVGGKTIWKNGCYILVTKVILSIPTDLKLLTEWLARTNITFGACRNVFSHTFTNNWINGTLYAYAFKNNRIFNNQNQASSEFCRDGLYLDSTTNNFYYRSAPYYQTGGYFCADQSSDAIQKYNLKYPTTLIDLGPRSYYLQEIIMSDDYDGYVVNQLKTSTFGDVSDLLNIFIISRLANTSFIQLIFSTQGANIFSYFNKRQRLQVDADYAQMISINSEIGVNEFDSENYPAIPGPPQDPIYFNGGNSSDGIFGIFFSSDTQVRDWISPKRTIVVPNGTIISNCTFSYFNVFTQKVPFYQWEIKTNSSGNSIFGSQGNSWFTTPVNGSSFFSFPYQKMDRIDTASRYSMNVSANNNHSYDKGFIWNYNAGNLDGSTTGWIVPPGQRISVGAPFYFYFGLKKGKSAWDRFAAKWIGFDRIID